MNSSKIKQKDFFNTVLKRGNNFYMPHGLIEFASDVSQSLV